MMQPLDPLPSKLAFIRVVPQCRLQQILMISLRAVNFLVEIGRMYEHHVEPTFINPNKLTHHTPKLMLIQLTPTYSLTVETARTFQLRYRLSSKCYKTNYASHRT